MYIELLLREAARAILAGLCERLPCFGAAGDPLV
jgi:hypothetical protein